MASVLRIALPAVLATVTALGPAVRPTSAADFDCIGFLRMYGMLRKASAACGFTVFNPAIVDRAHTCFDTLGNHNGAGAMRSGVAEFKRLRSVRDHDAACETLAARFPMVVRR